MSLNKRQARLTTVRTSMWVWPVALGLSTATGLCSALLADGWADAVSWFGLGLPLLVAGAYGLRWKR